jgi:hypothetical protein
VKTLSRIAVTAAVAVLMLSGCGDNGSGVSTAAGKQLNAQVDAIRTTAARADRGTAAKQLALLRASVDQLQSDGDLDASAATRIRQAADAVAAELVLLPPPTTTTTTTTTTSPPSDHGDKNDKARKHDEGRQGKDQQND